MIELFIFSVIVAIIEFLLLIDLEPKLPIPLWAIVVGILILLIPGLNLILILGLGVLLAAAFYDGYSLKGSNPVSKFFKSLNRTI